MNFITLAIPLGLLALGQPTEMPQAGASTLPPKLESYLASVVRPSEKERETLVRGGPLTKLLETDPSREVSVFGAIWIVAPIHRYVEAVNDIESFERGKGFHVTKRISSPPRLEDFAELRGSKEDLEDLRNCKVSDCKLKMGEQGLERIRAAVDWESGNASQRADSVLQELAYEYVTGYLEGGNDRLAVHRDKSRPTFVAEEFRSMIDQMPELTTYIPDVRRYLLEYPKASLPNSTSFLYWQEVEFGLKPTIRISHLVIQEEADGALVASKMLYASHYFWTALELRALIPDPSRGPGFWLVTVNRSRSDGLSGFTGKLVRGRVQSEVRDGMLAALQATKTWLEQPEAGESGHSHLPCLQNVSKTVPDSGELERTGENSLGDLRALSLNHLSSKVARHPSLEESSERIAPFGTIRRQVGLSPSFMFSERFTLPTESRGAETLSPNHPRHIGSFGTRRDVLLAKRLPFIRGSIPVRYE